MQYSWYFFEALVKSMAHYLIECTKVKVSCFLPFFLYFPLSVTPPPTNVSSSLCLPALQEPAFLCIVPPRSGDSG